MRVVIIVQRNWGTRSDSHSARRAGIGVSLFEQASELLEVGAGERTEATAFGYAAGEHVL